MKPMISFISVYLLAVGSLTAYQSQSILNEQKDLNAAFRFYQQQYVIALELLSTCVDKYNNVLLQKYSNNIDRFNYIRWYADARLKHINVSPNCQNKWFKTVLIYGRHISRCVESAKTDLEFIKNQVLEVIFGSQETANQVVLIGLKAFSNWNPLVHPDLGVAQLINVELMESLDNFIANHEEIELVLEYGEINYKGVTQGFGTCIDQFVNSFQYAAQKMVQTAEAAEC